MRNKLTQVAGEDSRRIMFGFMRTAALAMRAKVGHDHPEAVRRDPVRMAELDPVHVRVGEQAVEQDHGPALAYFMVGELDPVRCDPAMGACLSHPGRKLSKLRSQS